MEKNNIKTEKDETKNGVITNNNETKKTKSIGLLDKQFLPRNSMLTDLLRDKHIKNLYYMICAALMALFINTIAHDILYKNEFTFGHKVLFASFNDFHIVMFLWCILSAKNLLVYFSFRVWSKGALAFFPKSKELLYWNRFWIAALVFYYLFSFYVTAELVVHFDLTIVGSIILACEQVRLLMKSHSFIRENIGKVNNHKKKTESTVKIPEFSYYIYFLFVPTLVYRDIYPRTKSIDYKFVLLNFAEFLGAIFLISFIYEQHFVPVCLNFQSNHYIWKEIAWSILSNTLPALGISMCSFYCLLHAWMNAFAELTMFGDRQFYQDWWTATTYSTFYRKWNIVVHDWLFAYIYKDFFEYITPKNRVIPKLMVFLISAIVHEYILALCMRMLFPVLFLEFFGLGLALYFVSNGGGSIYTILFTYGYALGMSITVSSYTMEYCVRLNDCTSSGSLENGTRSFFGAYILTNACFV